MSENEPIELLHQCLEDEGGFQEQRRCMGFYLAELK